MHARPYDWKRNISLYDINNQTHSKVEVWVRWSARPKTCFNCDENLFSPLGCYLFLFWVGILCEMCHSCFHIGFFFSAIFTAQTFLCGLHEVHSHIMAWSDLLNWEIALELEYCDGWMLSACIVDCISRRLYTDCEQSAGGIFHWEKLCLARFCPLSTWPKSRWHEGIVWNET